MLRVVFFTFYMEDKTVILVYSSVYSDWRICQPIFCSLKT